MILIAGDSWAFGEWSDDNINLNHLGLTEYIGELRIPAMTIGNRGGSNYQSIESIKDFYLRSFGLAEQLQGIYVFQTEWVRDLIFFDLPQGGYHNVKAQLITKFYLDLVEFSFNHNGVPIYLIGGLSDVCTVENFTFVYPGITVAVPSFVNLLLNTNQPSTYMVTGYSMSQKEQDQRMKQIKLDSSESDLLEFIDDVNLGKKRMELFKNNPQYFWPDGRHPNRRAYKILFDYLLTNNFIKS